MSTDISRRTLTGILGGAALYGAAPRAARAAVGGRLVVGNWGGDSQKLLEDFVVPQLTSQGVEVAFDPAAESPRKVKLLAERALPRGTMDIAGMTSTSSFELWKLGALEELDETKVPAMANVLSQMKRSYAVPQFFSTRVIIYNPEKITKKPESYNDLWNPAYAGKVGVIDIQYQSTIESAALAAGGSVSNYEPGKQKLLELKQMGVKIYPTNEAMAQALKSGECWMCIMWQARGVLWRRAGIPIEFAYPREGLALTIFDFVVPKNSRNKDNAYAYLSAELSPQAQKGFAETFFYNPPLKDFPLPPELQKAIGIPPDMQDRLLLPDNAYLQQNDAQLKDWWDKVFKAS